MAMPRLTRHSAVSADYLDFTTSNHITCHAEKQGSKTRQENSGVSLPASLSSSSQVAWPTTFRAPGIALNSDPTIPQDLGSPDSTGSEGDTCYGDEMEAVGERSRMAVIYEQQSWEGEIVDERF